MASTDPFNYHCKHCGKTFASHSELGAHMSRGSCHPKAEGLSLDLSVGPYHKSFEEYTRKKNEDKALADQEAVEMPEVSTSLQQVSSPSISCITDEVCGTPHASGDEEPSLVLSLGGFHKSFEEYTRKKNEDEALAKQKSGKKPEVSTSLQQVSSPSISWIAAEFCGTPHGSGDLEPSLVLSLGGCHKSFEENTWMKNEDKVLADQEAEKRPEASTNEMVLTPLKRKVSGLRMHRCNICGKEFMTPGALGGHMSQSQCNPKRTGKEGAKKTERSNKAQEMVSEPRKYYCKYCGKEFPSFHACVGHMSHCKQVVFAGPDRFYCSQCGRNFPSVRSLGSHKRNYMLKVARPNCARRLDLVGPTLEREQNQKSDHPSADLGSDAVLTRSINQQADEPLHDVGGDAADFASDHQSASDGSEREEADPQ